MPVARIAHGENHLAIAEVGQRVQAHTHQRAVRRRVMLSAVRFPALGFLDRAFAPTARGVIATGDLDDLETSSVT